MQLFVDACVQGIMIGAVFALIALGLAVIHAVSGVLNFAHGHLVVLAMYLAVIAKDVAGLDPYVSFFLIVPVMFVVGIALYLLIFRRLTGTHVLTAIQATLGLVFLIEGLLLITQGGQFKRIETAIDAKAMSLGPVHVEAKEFIAFAVALAASAVLFYTLSRTGYGRSIRAVLQNPRGAQLVAVNINRVRLVTFGLGVALAGAAGVLLVPGSSVHPSQGLGYTVFAILAYFIGGPGNLLGTFFAALLLGLSESLGAIYLPDAYGFILPYIIVVVVILLRPQGLFGQKGMAR